MDSLEAMCNEYVVAILHSAINVTRDNDMRPEYEVIGDEKSRRIDYTIKVSLPGFTLFAISLDILTSYFISGCQKPYLHHGE